MIYSYFLVDVTVFLDNEICMSSPGFTQMLHTFSLRDVFVFNIDFVPNLELSLLSFILPCDNVISSSKRRGSPGHFISRYF